MSVLRWVTFPLPKSREASRAQDPERAVEPEAQARRATGRRISIVVLLGLVVLVGLEIRTSWLQSRVFSAVARRLTFGFDSTPGSAPRFPGPGPYDLRLGYARLPMFVDRLASDFRVTRQARLSPTHRRLVDLGLFPIYEEKSQAGARVLDRRGHELHVADYPQRVYESFDDIPPLVVRMLLFIENRELLDENHPHRNPAVEWDRLARALLEKGAEPLHGRRVPGASTLATQLEKLRHSPGGRTDSAAEKLRQMLSASLRAYRRGEVTLEARRDIFLQYINSLPLAAIAGFGEVQGLGDGLWAWYGADPAQVNARLASADSDADDGELSEKAVALRQALSLCVAQRRPSFYLLRDPGALDEATRHFLRLLRSEAVISEALYAQAARAEVTLRSRAPDARELAWGKKPVLGVRSRVAAILGLADLYDFDRLDLQIATTFDGAAQSAVLAALGEVGEAKGARAAGLVGPRMLGRGDPEGVLYSLTLYERVGDANLLRVQADTYDRPLDLNEGVKLELGSTAKLRTLVTYLEIVAELHERLGTLTRAERRRIEVGTSDRLTRWAIEYLGGTSDRSLGTMLEAAMNRRYSAHPGEGFFTGGGRHVFHNFEASENRRVASVREGFRDSINLVFIRLMRDIVSYYALRVPGSSAKILEDVADPRRQEYLVRFADREGSEFLRRFYRRHHGQAPDEALRAVLADAQPAPHRFAVIIRSVRPELGFAGFAALMRGRLRDSSLSERTLRKLYEDYAPGRHDLADRGYLARIHPLQLWLLAYLGDHPQATLEEVLAVSVAERQAVYRWLFTTRRKNAQDIRIRSLLEVEAFLEIHKAWKRLGYPFESLVPSYATAIGSSADRPAALAELIGIILADGVRYPTQRIDELRFAAGTPYETQLARVPRPPERLLRPEIAAQLRRELIGVVEEGTARRLKGSATLDDGTLLVVGGKTGTGDNRRDVYGRRGQLLESRPLNRTATFVFFIGDRFFGTITSYVPGARADEYEFTSSLSLQVLKGLLPILRPLLEEPPAPPAADAT